jgi:dihydrofolate synthase/folylpolyglutamate synthase
MHADISFASEHWHVEEISSNESYLTLNIYQNKNLKYENLSIDLIAGYQKKNIVTVLESVEHLRKFGYIIRNEHIHSALRNVKTLTGLMGRWQKLNDKPLTYCDVGHNKEGIIEVLKQLNRVPHQHLHFVLGMVNDKDISGVLSILPVSAAYYFCKADIPRAMNAEELMQKAETFGIFGIAISSVNEALKAAQENAGEQDLVFVGGSTFVVAEVL